MRRLTDKEKKVLRFINVNGPVEPPSISDGTGIRPRTVSSILRRLREWKIIVRTKDMSLDMRRSFYSIARKIR